MPTSNFQPIRFCDTDWSYKFAYLMPKSADPDQLASSLFAKAGHIWVCLFVLWFYCPVNPMGSCRVWSVYLTTRLLGRLRPLSV